MTGRVEDLPEWEREFLADQFIRDEELALEWPWIDDLDVPDEAPTLRALAEGPRRFLRG